MRANATRSIELRSFDERLFLFNNKNVISNGYSIEELVIFADIQKKTKHAYQ